MWNPFKKTPEGEDVLRPVSGRVIRLDDVPDPVFAGRSMGDGFAVEPDEGTFCAPVAGELVLLAETLHAYALRTASGAEILVHVGVDTVMLKGAGFTAHRKQGDRVAAGDPIVSCDLGSVAAAVPSMATPVILTNATQGYTISQPNLEAPPGGAVASITVN